MDNNLMIEGLAPGPDGTLLRFFYDSAKNERASINEGRAIFDTVLYADVIAPGQGSSTPRFELERVWSEQSINALGLVEPYRRSAKYEEFFDQVEKFKRLEGDMDLGGTPLKMWPRIDRGLAATLASLNILTVEHLAGVPDSALDRIGMGARALRDQARSFLDTAGGSREVSQLTERATAAEAEAQRLQADLITANAELRVMQARVAQLEQGADQAKKPSKSLV